MTGSGSAEHWRARLAALPLDTRPFVDGARVDALADDTFELSRTGTGEPLATAPDCSAADVDRAVRAARRTYEAGVWRDLTPSARREVLRRFAARIAADADCLGLLDTVQMGMPVSVSVPGIAAAAETVSEQADLAVSMHDELRPAAPSALAMSVRRPQGVVAALTAWNFPVHVALARVAPALAAGNSVVLKPSEYAPLACLRLAELAADAGLPRGVFNALPGRGVTTGNALALHADVDCLAFVGSTATGLQLMQAAGRSNLKKLLLECGGKSPQIVLDDVGDLDALADALVDGFTWNSGQLCVTGSRILVATALYDRLVAALTARVRATTIGDPLDPATALGPLANATQHARVTRLLAAAAPTDALAAEGRSGGGACEFAPRLYTSSDASSPLVQEEIFGPVSTVLRCPDDATALALANGTRYGLSATVWCADFARAQRLVRGLRAGFVTVNAVARPAPSQAHGQSGEPFGASGFGPEGGLAGLQAYTRLQSITHHLA